MAAIRANRNEIIDYLIDQLAINVHYATYLREFHVRAKTKPARRRKMTCRDLAYRQGNSEVVDLIDIISDDIPLNTKRYLIKRLETRLNHIRQAHNQRIEERSKQFLFQLNEEPPMENITDEKIIPSIMLPSISQQSYRSHIEETIQNINPPKDKSFDQTKKKTFHFSNYNLRYRLVDTPDSNNKQIEQSQIPSLPPLSSFTLSRTSLIPSKNILYSMSQTSSYESPRDTHRHESISHSPRLILPTLSTTPTIKRSATKRNNQNNVKYTYIPQEQQQQQNRSFNHSQRILPITFKSTAIGLTSNTRTIRD